MAQGRQPLIQRMQVDVRQQRTDHRALRRARHGRPPCHAPQDVLPEPAADQAEDPTIADPLLDPAHQPLVRDALEGSGHRLPITVVVRIR